MDSHTMHISTQRAEYSKLRLAELKERLTDLPELKAFQGLTIFGVGSYARLEAGHHSDLDLFFLGNGECFKSLTPRTEAIRLFGKIVEVAQLMKFPQFSNDCEFLVIQPAADIISHLGSRKDDHLNYFTARMLLLLESHCLFGEPVYEEVLGQIVDSYFKDYPDHQQTFQPTFLMNDISRFWKTLLLNYENKRQLGEDLAENSPKKVRHKVRNFKLKFSRMTTCFASIAALGSHQAPVTRQLVVELTKMTPRERLDSIPTRIPRAKPAVEKVLGGYAWFLEMTGLTTGELEGHFADKSKRTEMFQRANDYGDSMFALLQAIDQSAPQLKLLRTVVI